MYLHRHTPLSATTKALQNSLRSLLEPSTATKIFESFIQFPDRCYWESVLDLASIFRKLVSNEVFNAQLHVFNSLFKPFKDALTMKTDYLRLVKNHVSRQIPKYSFSPLDSLITLFLSGARASDYLALFRNSNATPDGQLADSKTSFLWSALDLFDETAQKVDGDSLNLFRLLNGPGANTAKNIATVRQFIYESGYTLTPDICAKICTKLLKVRFAVSHEIT